MLVGPRSFDKVISETLRNKELRTIDPVQFFSRIRVQGI